MNWFGTSWGAPICAAVTHVPTPAGESCAYCEEPIEAEDSGVMIDAFEYPKDTRRTQLFRVVPRPHHRECFFREIFGSIGHLTGRCTCHGGKDDDPAGLTRREAARLTEQWVTEHMPNLFQRPNSIKERSC